MSIDEYFVAHLARARTSCGSAPVKVPTAEQQAMSEAGGVTGAEDVF